MEIIFLNISVRHENKNNYLTLLHYSVLLMMVFMKIKSLNNVTKLFASYFVLQQ